MNIGERIKSIRKAKGLSQKEVVAAIGMGAAQYSRIENGKTDPSVSTLERIAGAMGVRPGEFFGEGEKQETEIRSADSSVMERARLIEALDEEEKKTIFNIMDAFIGRKRLKETLSSALQDVA